MTKRNIFLFIIISIVLLASCEDVITDDITLDEGASQLAVDAWLTNMEGTQTIRLTTTQAYFDNTPAPPATGATISVEDNEGNIFNFTDPDNDGNYTWEPSSPSETFGKVGNFYQLNISYQGETFEAVSEMRRVPEIDSIFYEFRDDEVFGEDGYYAELYARDLEGTGDTYWIKTYKNGEFLGKPEQINIAFDSGFSEGGNIDGLIFITPIREGINPEETDENDNALPPYDLGDEIKVEIHSITQEAFFFFGELINQLNNGGLFAVPSANVSTNIINTNPNGSRAVGFFNTAAVSTETTRVEE